MSPTGGEKTLSERIMIRVSKKLRTTLEKLAEADRRDLSEFIRLILEDYAAKKK